MRAILINPFDRTVEEFNLEPGLRAMYAALSGPGFPVEDDCPNGFPTDPGDWQGLEREQMDVHCIDIRSLGGAQDLICDDNGRCIGFNACFQLGEALIAGRALIVSHDREGETIGTTLPVELARSTVKWLAWDTDYTPPAPTVIGFDSFDMLKFLV